MKIQSLGVALLLCSSLAACSKSDYSHDATVLPEKARTTLSQNFTAAVSLVKEEKATFGASEYEVILTNGSEITFNHDGEWTDIETPVNVGVPQGLVPTAITNYVRQKHAGALIVGIDKEKKGFEVELSNGVDIKFDLQGNFVSYDN